MTRQVLIALRDIPMPIELYSTVLEEPFAVDHLPMKTPAPPPALVVYTLHEFHELGRFSPDARELRVLHQAKRLFGGQYIAPRRGELCREAA